MEQQVFAIAAVLVALAAAAWDLRTRRIPNVLTYGATGLAFALHAFVGGFTGFSLSVAGWALGLALFAPFFLLRGMGAGDVKLIAALGAWLGPGLVVWTALYTAIAGGILAIAVSLYYGYLRQALTNLGGALLYWRTEGPKPVPGLTLAAAAGPRLPYALPILVGMVAALWLR